MKILWKHPNSDMWTHPQWVGATRILRVSPVWKSQLHITRFTDVSPAFCNCQVKKWPPLKNHKKAEAKLYLKRKIGARLAVACFGTPSWWWHLLNKNVTFSIYAGAGRKMKSTRVGVKPFFSKKLKQKTNWVIISEKLI